jgi:hypothetical protein
MKLLAILEDTSERQRALKFQQRIIDEVDDGADIKLMPGADTGIAIWRKIPLVLKVTFSYGLTKIFSVPREPDGGTFDSIDTVKNAFKKYKPTTQAGAAKVMMTKLREKYGKLLVAGTGGANHFVNYAWVYANDADKRKDAGGGTLTRNLGVKVSIEKSNGGFTYYVDRSPCESLDDMLKCINTALSLKS